MTRDAEVSRVTTRLSAAEIYEAAEYVSGLWKGETDEGLGLFRGEVVENDSPGAGRSDDADIEPFLPLTAATQLRKVLHLEAAPGASAQLAFVAREAEGNTATLVFLVNGEEVRRPPSSVATPAARQYEELSWSRWYYVDVPPGLLRQGANEIRVCVEGAGAGWDLMVADYRDFYKGMDDPVVLPHASLRTDDGGETWSEERGEYVLRLALDRYAARGELRTPVLDAARLPDEAITGGRAVEGLRISWSGLTPPGTVLEVQARTGTEPVPDEAAWSDWISCTSAGPLEEVRGRYLQLRAELSTADLVQTPSLTELTVEAQVRAASGKVPRVAAARNGRLERSSWSMAHEDPRCPMLRRLRRECELDAVVAGAQTQFQAIQRLHAWAYHIPLGDCTHFPWEVMEWIDVHRGEEGGIELNEYSQRRRDKMCLYPNVVLAAALQSFGYPARHLNFHSEGMTGHEICEVWSNDHDKWIHLDATRDYYWHDRRTLVPLDTLEIHAVLAGRLEQVETWESPYLYRQDLEALGRDLPIAYWDGEYEHSVGAGDHGALFLFRSFCHLRVIPRFDVFSRARPLPVSQGTEVWSWNGYLNWADDRVPPLRHFSHHTNRRADLYPALNRTRFTAVSSDDGRRLQVALETDTPDFETYEVRVDGGRWRDVEARWDWPLHEGVNTAEMRTRNRSGVPGPASSLCAVP